VCLQHTKLQDALDILIHSEAQFIYLFLLKILLIYLRESERVHAELGVEEEAEGEGQADSELSTEQA